MAIRIEVRPYGKFLHLHTDPDAMARACYRTAEGREEVVDAIGNCVGFAIWDVPKGGVHIGVFDGEVRTLVHEIVHAALHVLERAGIDPTHANGEPLAYLVDDLFGQLVGPFNAAVAASKEK